MSGILGYCCIWVERRALAGLEAPSIVIVSIVTFRGWLVDMHSDGGLGV